MSMSMVRIREHYREDNTPRAQDVLPAAFAAVRDSAGKLLLVRRIDDGNWELPGGRIEVGESAVDAVVREVAEESGITIEVTGIAGVYSDPTHVLVDPGGITHQQLAICFHAAPKSSADESPPRPDGIETNAAAWFATTEIAALPIHPAVRLRIDNAVRAPHHPFFEQATPESAIGCSISADRSPRRSRANTVPDA
ncbi:NUDIX hydrolase [Aldersonia kunmingensis]|uniref:NUDIX hydrolase n=1 Tax=Aldersonia kunmingensis TaxID=408066 RepID=UPI0012EDDB88|nr:NUDIX domain-containing protein [Aldersonia kunmingensis]